MATRNPREAALMSGMVNVALPVPLSRFLSPVGGGSTLR
jgi:hypothetical protein